jgi:acylphosphatase
LQATKNVSLKGMSTMSAIRMRAIVRGRVQGVCFRAETREQARRLGLCGWVRNLPDGRVEVLAEGSEQHVRELIAWCQTGPPHARVDMIEEFPESFSGEFDTFSITY